MTNFLYKKRGIMHINCVKEFYIYSEKDFHIGF